MVTKGCSSLLYLLLISVRVTGVPGSNPAATRLEARLWDTGSFQDLHMIYCRGPSSALRAAKMGQGERRSRSRNPSGTSENSGASILTEHRRNSPSSLALLDRVVVFFFFPVVRTFNVLFQFTLGRPLCHINQGWQRMPGSVFCQSEGPCSCWQRFIGAKMAIFGEAKVARPHS